MREVHLPPSDKRTTVTVPVHHPDRGKAPVPLDIAVGERLRIGATHWERRLFNGTIVTVEALEQRKDRVLITGRTDTGREVRFHHDEIRDYHGRIRLEHGYALTIASAQGLTAERVFLYADDKAARRGIWRGEVAAPWEWRKGKRLTGAEQPGRGPYNPDWAFVTERDQRLYFVRGTKSTLDTEERQTKENQKIACGRRHFGALGVDYDIVTSLSEVSI